MIAVNPARHTLQGGVVDVLWQEKHAAEQALDAAHRALSKAQREFARARKQRDAARLRWLDAAEERAALPDLSDNPLMQSVLEILDAAPRRRAAVR